jgi:predicted nucleic acid-binding protein
MVKARYLVDSSVFVDGEPECVAEALGPLLDAGEVATCAVVQLVLLDRITDPKVRAEVAVSWAAAFQWLPTTDDDLRRALDVQRLFCEARQYKVGWHAFVVAAVAERHEVAVLHWDASFSLIAEVTGQTVESVPRGVGEQTT